jgi:hypothetical protein
VASVILGTQGADASSRVATAGKSRGKEGQDDSSSRKNGSSHFFSNQGPPFMARHTQRRQGRQVVVSSAILLSPNRIRKMSEEDVRVVVAFAAASASEDLPAPTLNPLQIFARRC